MMTWNQIHDQINWIITSSLASSFVNRADDSALIWWERCGAEIPKIVNKFEDTFIPQIKNSNSHHKDSSGFTGKLYMGIRTLHETLPVNLFIIENEISVKSIIRLLIRIRIHMSPYKQWSKKAKSNSNHLYTRECCTKKYRYAQQYIRITLIHSMQGKCN